MDLRLHNKVIVVAGGAQGIGEDIVDHLMGEGALPVVFDRVPGKGFTLKVEFTDRHSVARAVRIVQEHFGHIDGLINIPGSSDKAGPSVGYTCTRMQSFEENVGQYYAVAQALLSYLKASQGSIVNIVSELWETEQVEVQGYNSFNSALAALTEQWAEETRGDGIRVNGVVVSDCQSQQLEAPTDLTRLPRSLWARIKRLLHLGRRLTKVEEIAGTVAFLLSRQSRSINGKLLRIDGGYIHADSNVGVN